MSAAVAYVNYPLEEVIKCQLCPRRKGVFKAASRKDNYARHLKSKHQITVENIKVRCSVCGRVSGKPRLSAWRDTQAHYNAEHAHLKIVNKSVAEQPQPGKLLKTENVPSFPHPQVYSQQVKKKVGVKANVNEAIHSIVSGMGDMFNVARNNAAGCLFQDLIDSPKLSPIQSNRARRISCKRRLTYSSSYRTFPFEKVA